METKNKISRFDPVAFGVEKLDNRFEEINSAMRQDELINRIADNYSAKSTYEEWGESVRVSEKYILPVLHWISALSAFMGVFSVAVILCALIPFTSFQVFGFSIAQILGVFLTVGILYLIENWKTFSIKITVPKWLNRNLRMQYKKRLPFYFAFVFVMVGISFATSFFGGIETPAAVTKEPERKKAAIIDATKTTESSLESVNSVTKSYDDQIAAAQKEKQDLESEKQRNENTAKTKRRANGNDTGWREQMKANKASSDIKDIQKRIDQLMTDKQAAIQTTASLANTGLFTINKANEIEIAETNALNTKNYESYATKIKKSSWAMGIISLSTDFLIILLEYLALYYQWVCGKEWEVVNEVVEKHKQAKTTEKQPLKQPFVTNEPVLGVVAAGAEKPQEKVRMSEREFLEKIADCDECVFYEGEWHDNKEVEKIIKNIRIYYARSIAPIKEGVTGENAESAKKAKLENAEKVRVWTAILSTAGVDAVIQEGKLKLLFPYK